MDWFVRLFGFPEADLACDRDSVVEIRPGSLVDPKTTNTLLLATRKPYARRVFQVGRFETPSLAELRLAVVDSADKVQALSGPFTFSLQLGMDVSALHRKEDGAVFQVASQFNCLEFPSPSSTPEQGVTNYVYDRTQGPACCLSCGPATVYRNWLHPREGVRGQTAGNMINNLAEVEELLDNKKHKYFAVQHGYTLSTDAQLARLNAVLASQPALREELKARVRVGVQFHTQVTASNWGRDLLESETPVIVTQVFCSACSVAYSNGSDTNWEPFASLILEAEYEAMLLAALSAYLERKPPAPPTECRVFLTTIGAGVFGNSIRWVADAIRAACDKVRRLGLRMHVCVVCYKDTPDPEIAALDNYFNDGGRSRSLN